MSSSEAEHGTKYVVRIEHSVPDFAQWKVAFDRDPVSREAGGVRRYRILRPVDDPHYAMVDLEFDSADQATRFCEGLGRLWRNVEGELVERPQVRIVHLLEFKEF